MNPIGKVNPFNVSGPNLSSGSGLTTQGADFYSTTSKTSFKDVMGNVISDTNKTLTVPDELMNRALTTGDVDIHQIMIANTKADITVNLVSQVITKVLQAYDRVQQIQV